MQFLLYGHSVALDLLPNCAFLAVCLCEIATTLLSSFPVAQILPLAPDFTEFSPLIGIRLYPAVRSSRSYPSFPRWR